MPNPARLLLAPLALGLGLCGSVPASAQDAVPPAAIPPSETRIGMIYRPEPAPSSYDAEAIPEDEGVAGARMAVKDNNNTGRFTKQTYLLEEVALEGEKSAGEAARDLAGRGIRYLVVALPAADLLAVADAVKGQGVTVFNVAAPDDRLRGADCRRNVFHVIPSRAM